MSGLEGESENENSLENLNRTFRELPENSTRVIIHKEESNEYYKMEHVSENEREGGLEITPNLNIQNRSIRTTRAYNHDGEEYDQKSEALDQWAYELNSRAREMKAFREETASRLIRMEKRSYTMFENFSEGIKLTKNKISREPAPSIEDALDLRQLVNHQFPSIQICTPREQLWRMNV